MNLVRCKDLNELTQKAHLWLEHEVARHHVQSVFLPAGRTPQSLYQKWEQEQPAFLKGLRLVQIDDILTGAKRGEFRQFFADALPTYQNQFEWIENTKEPRIADVAILGFGKNGHVAFHEPAIHPSMDIACVHLSATTCQQLQIEADSWGISYGLHQFNKAKALLLMIVGSGKREAYEAFLKKDSLISASHLIGHPQLTVLVVEDSL